MRYTLHKADRNLNGNVTLAGSKSISNRALIIKALCKDDFTIHRPANAKDTRLLNALLQSNDEVRDAGAAGTTFRFLTAFLSMQPGVQILTGSERMKQRPIGVLVEALRRLGANIDYIGREGYPPLRIGEPDGLGRTSRLSIPAGTSSQYISALLLIAPVLPSGLELTLEGTIVSRPYIEMTLDLMRFFGADSFWEGNRISVPAQDYLPKEFTVEADWSAASYYYAMAAFAGELNLSLEGLFAGSLQGDAVLAEMMEAFGIRTEFDESGIRLSKFADKKPEKFEWDFLRCPDLAQTLAVVCAGLGTKGLFTGLDTLSIKETDRIAALQTELAKTGVRLSKSQPPPGRQPRDFYSIEGHADLSGQPAFDTYEDHRMAMAFAPLALLGPITINDPEVVEKSYPDFWNDLEKLGFEIKFE